MEPDATEPVGQHNGGIFIFKHSDRCPISKRAEQVVDRFETDLPMEQVTVQEDRALSDRIAEETGVEHETPQVILVHDGDVVWHASHEDITEDALRRAEEKLK